ncbi:probable kinesin-related protein KLPA [Weissella oryzae SG25]|uniref:Probable kinesin-related protein KLPA n=1 Tax=Weissella oryzae (strain DSM 25784 / JCM 18191 / LMG 30913 / SG25) TaxID=1329250 RepID=A0A069D1V3_WEIOS|nr:hypothetical protein [Weissella oryzae]GAK31321.1 probable kinesin-related protein KLPA [Weissella oryzae SG25]
MKPTKKANSLRQKIYQDELEKQRQQRDIELRKQLQAENIESEAAVSELKRKLENEKSRVASVIFERLVDDKFALITSKDLDLKVTSNILLQSELYQVISDFYDKIAEELGLIRIKIDPDNREAKRYLTTKQLSDYDYKSEELNVVFGTNKDYQEVRKRRLKDITFLIFYPWLFAPILPLIFSLMALWFRHGDVVWNDPRFLLLNFVLLLVFPIATYITAWWNDWEI